jgi:hypothetical protein
MWYIYKKWDHYFGHFLSSWFLKGNVSGLRPRIESQWGRFFAHFQTNPGAHPASCTMDTGSFPGLKRPWRGADHPPLQAPMSRMNRALPLLPRWPVIEWPLFYIYIYIYKSNPITGLDRPIEFQEVEAHGFLDYRHMMVVRLSALRTGRLYLPGIIPGTHFC